VTSGLLRHVIIRGVDLALISLSFALSYWTRTNWDALSGGGALVWDIVNPANASQFTALLVTAVLVSWLSLDVTESTEYLRALRPLDEVFVVIRAMTMGHVLLLAAASQYSRYAFSRGALLFLYPLTILTLSIWRVALKLWLERTRRAGADVRKMLVIGAGETGQLVARSLAYHPEYGLQIVGFADDDPALAGTTVCGHRVLGELGRTSALAREHGTADVLIAIPDIPRPMLLELIRQCEEERATVMFVPSPADLATTRNPIFHIGGIPVVAAPGEPIHGWGRVAKRLLDITVAGLMVLLLSPLLLALVILIRLDSAGPAVYRQRRVGKGGREFTMFKFRSMVADAEAQRPDLEHLNESTGGVTFKLRDDPRITRVGRLLRRLSLDELPQLFNILRGEMSLVGPRPPLVTEVNLYSKWVRKRLEAVPGLTGLWQVSGRSEIGFDRMVEMDLFYIEHWSFWLDVWILIRTIPAVLSGRGAY
jgi:exopolysaccharide biosynthesis polyprenyl glycosylphosphotransferase